MRLPITLAATLLAACNAGPPPDCILPSGLQVWGVSDCLGIQKSEVMMLKVYADTVSGWSQDDMITVLSHWELYVVDLEEHQARYPKTLGVTYQSLQRSQVGRGPFFFGVITHEFAHAFEIEIDHNRYRSEPPDCSPSEGAWCDPDHPWWKTRGIFNVVTTVYRSMKAANIQPP